MKKLARATLALLVGTVATVGTFAATDGKRVRVEDCVSVKRIVPSEVKVEPDGKRVAYLVSSPNIVTNENDYQLWLRDLGDGPERKNGRMVFQSVDDLSGLTWLSDGSHVALVERARKDKSSIWFIDVDSGRAEMIEDVQRGIRSYSVDATGNVIAYATPMPTAYPDKDPNMTARGFAIPFGYSVSVYGEDKADGALRFEITVLRREATGQWRRSVVSSLAVEPFADKKPVVGFFFVTSISLSPDGNYLVIDFEPDNIPQNWHASRSVQQILDQGTIPLVAGICDLRTGRLSLALESPHVSAPPAARWSDDSKAFAIYATPPVGSTWEKLS